MVGSVRKALVVASGGSLLDNSCVNSATSFAGVIDTNGDRTANFSTQLELGVNTASGLRCMISELFSSVANDLVFFYSGYGFFDNSGGGLLAHNDQCNVDWVSMTELLAKAAKARANNKVLILDLCRYEGECCFLPLSSKLFAAEGVALLAANRLGGEPLEGADCGVFVQALLDALRGGAADVRGNISVASLYNYIDRVLGESDRRPLFLANTRSASPLRTIENQVPPYILKKIVEYFPFPEVIFSLDPSFEPSNHISGFGVPLKPYANQKNASIFNHLNMMQSIGLLEPVDATCMYLAAMESKACNLTPLGRHYWMLIKKGVYD